MKRIRASNWSQLAIVINISLLPSCYCFLATVAIEHLGPHELLAGSVLPNGALGAVSSLLWGSRPTERLGSQKGPVNYWKKVALQRKIFAR